MATSGRGIQVEYPVITLHAVSRADSRPSIYCQLDESAGIAEQDVEPGNEEDDTPMRELSIVPKDAESRQSFTSPLHHLPDPNFNCILQWTQYSRLCHIVPPYIQILQDPMTWTTTMTTRLSTRLPLRHLTATRGKSSAKSGGCAAISLMITAMLHIRLNHHFFPLWLSDFSPLRPHDC